MRIKGYQVWGLDGTNKVQHVCLIALKLTFDFPRYEAHAYYVTRKNPRTVQVQDPYNETGLISF